MSSAQRSMILIPFGKYKGRSLEQIRLCDPQYVIWMKENCDSLENHVELKKAIEAIYDDCIDAANRKITDEPQRRKSASAFGRNYYANN